MKTKKKKAASESDSEEDPASKHIRKSRKVMSKHLADEIDAEAKSDGAGLKVAAEERSKMGWTKPHIREIDLERALYRWYEGYKTQRLEVSETETVLTVDELVKKAKSLMQRLGAAQSLVNVITKSWIVRWQERYGVPKAVESPQEEPERKSEEKVILEPIKQRLKKRRLKKTEEEEGEEEEVNGGFNPEDQTNMEDERVDVPLDVRQVLTVDTGQQQEDPPPIYSQDLKSVLNEYDNDQIYFALCFEFNWTSLPDKAVHVKDDPIWLLMAANRSGRHRTRILVTGRQWRPGCLKHVNMVSQPVVYAGGGRGTLTPDLFAWWFRREFIPAAESFSSTAVLLVEEKWFSPKLNDNSNRNVTTVKVPLSETEDWDLIFSEFKTRYATLLLRNVISMSETTCENYVGEYLTNFTLKDAFALFHKSWLSVRSESFHRLIDEDAPHGKSMECISATLIQTALEPESGLINLTKGEETEVKDECKSVGREEKKPSGRLALTKKEKVLLGYQQEDRMLLLELQWLAHDAGLEVTDEGLSSWVFEKVVKRTERVKTEEEDEEGSEAIPTAEEAARCLNKTLLWMETQPIDCNLLMMVRDVADMAKQASKMGLAPPHPGAALPFFCHNGDHLTQPPPAHMGIPPYQLDAKGAGAMGLSRTPMYPFSAGSTYPYPMLSPEMSQVPASWHTPGMYPISAGAGFRSPYPTSLPISSTTLPSDFYRFSPTSLLPGHPGLSPHGHHSLSSHPAIVTPGPKQELGHHTQSDHNHRIFWGRFRSTPRPGLIGPFWAVIGTF